MRASAIRTRTDSVHRIVWRCDEPIPRGQDVGHRCRVELCQRPDDHGLLSKPDNTRDHGPTRGARQAAAVGGVDGAGGYASKAADL